MRECEQRVFWFSCTVARLAAQWDVKSNHSDIDNNNGQMTARTARTATAALAAATNQQTTTATTRTTTTPQTTMRTMTRLECRTTTTMTTSNHGRPRTTHHVEEQMRNINVEDWLTKVRRYKWRWAKRIAQHEFCRWTQRVVNWHPDYDVRLNMARTRRIGHRRTRWEDDVNTFLFQEGIRNQHWTVIAKEGLQWDALEEDYIGSHHATQGT